MIFRIKDRIRLILVRIAKCVIWNRHKERIFIPWSLEDDLTFCEYRKFISENDTVNYKIKFIDLPQVEARYKWVGAQVFGNHVYAIPNDMSQVLRLGIDKAEFFGSLEKNIFKWTGGCIWNENLYGFPRTNNSFMKMNLETMSIDEVPISVQYPVEHHYGGVCTKNGVVYQPPRDTDHILVTDLSDGHSWKLQIMPEKWHMKLRYCGSVMHPNGFIYFLPEYHDKVIKLNPQTGVWTFIGDPISSMVFDAKVATDGNIFGYSAYCSGILKIDVMKDTVEMIHTDISPGAYGTKLGINGHLYSVPGDGNVIWDFNPIKDTLNRFTTISDSSKAKYAGGVTTKDGDLYFIPATARSVMMMECNNTSIPENIYESFFVDNY